MPGRPSTFPVATEGPPVRIQFEMGYDAVRDPIVLFGSVNNKLQWVLNDLWGVRLNALDPKATLTSKIAGTFRIPLRLVETPPMEIPLP